MDSTQGAAPIQPQDESQTVASVLEANMTAEQVNERIGVLTADIVRFGMTDPTQAAKLTRELSRLISGQGSRLQKAAEEKNAGFMTEIEAAAHTFFEQMDAYAKERNLPAFRVNVVVGLTAAHSGPNDEEGNGSRARWWKSSERKTRESHPRAGLLFAADGVTAMLGGTEYKTAQAAVEALIAQGFRDKSGQPLSLTGINQKEGSKNFGQSYEIPATTVLKNAGLVWKPKEEAAA